MWCFWYGEIFFCICRWEIYFLSFIVWYFCPWFYALTLCNVVGLVLYLRAMLRRNGQRWPWAGLDMKKSDPTQTRKKARSPMSWVIGRVWAAFFGKHNKKIGLGMKARHDSSWAWAQFWTFHDGESPGVGPTRFGPQPSLDMDIGLGLSFSIFQIVSLTSWILRVL